MTGDRHGMLPEVFRLRYWLAPIAEGRLLTCIDFSHTLLCVRWEVTQVAKGNRL